MVLGVGKGLGRVHYALYVFQVTDDIGKTVNQFEFEKNFKYKFATTTIIFQLVFFFRFYYFK